MRTATVLVHYHHQRFCDCEWLTAQEKDFTGINSFHINCCSCNNKNNNILKFLSQCNQIAILNSEEEIIN